MASAASGNDKEQILVRVSADTYAALQLAQPFVGRRSMQDLASAIIEDFLTLLRAREPGFEKAMAGLRESRAHKDGVLAKRSISGRGHSPA